MAVFPTSVPTDSDLYIAINTGVTALTAGIDNVTLTIPANTTGFPSVGFITIDSEIIKYTSISPTQFNASLRGADGTAANSHLNGAQVNHFIIAAHHNAPKDEIIAIAQNISDRIGLGATQLKAQDGSVSAPSYAFATSPDSGIYLTGTGSIRFTSDGVNTVSVISNGLEINLDGSASTPSINFGSDPDTGLYLVSADKLGITAGGTNVVNVTPNSVSIFNTVNPADQLYVARSNSGGNVSIQASNLSDTASSAARLIAAVAGTNAGDPILTWIISGGTPQQWTMGPDNSDLDAFVLAESASLGTSNRLRIPSGGQFQTVDGAVGTPTYSFIGDTDTGIYRSASNTLVVATGGTNALVVSDIEVTIGSSRGLQVQDGTAASPGIRFNGDQDTGIYRIGVNEIGFSTGGTIRASLSSAAFSVEGSTRFFSTAGSVSLPSYSFGSDQDTGIYNNAANELSFVTGGTRYLRISNEILAEATIRFDSGPATARIWANDGTVSNPSYSFHADVDTGIYRTASNSLGITLGGVLQWDFNANGSVRGQSSSTNLLQPGFGSVSTPGFGFTGDEDTGIYRVSSNKLGIAAGGIQTAEFNLTGSSDGVQYTPLTMFGGTAFGGGTASMNFHLRSTASVSTTPVEICGTEYGFLVVNGLTGGGAAIFTDFILMHYGSNATVVASKNSNSPAARTYTLTGGDKLSLAMASGTYSIHTTFFRCPIR